MNGKIVDFSTDVGEFLHKIPLGHLQSIDINEGVIRATITRSYYSPLLREDEISFNIRDKWIGSIFVDLIYEQIGDRDPKYKYSIISDSSFEKTMMRRRQNKLKPHLEKIIEIIKNYSYSLK